MEIHGMKLEIRDSIFEIRNSTLITQHPLIDIQNSNSLLILNRG